MKNSLAVCAFLGVDSMDFADKEREVVRDKRQDAFNQLYIYTNWIVE